MGKSLVACVIGALLLGTAGCGSNIRRNGEAAREALLIDINPRVSMPKHLFYESVAQHWGQAVAQNTGLIGALIGVAVASSGTDPDIATYFQQHAIDVGAIYGEEMERALSQRTQIQLTHGGRVNRLVLSVEKYGFQSSESFGGKMRIVMDVKAELYDPSGHKIWSKGSNASHAKWPELSINQYLADPDHLVESFHAIAEDMSSRLRSDLLSKHADIVSRQGVAYARISVPPSEPRVINASYVPSAPQATAPAPQAFASPAQQQTFAPQAPIQMAATESARSTPYAHAGAIAHGRPQTRFPGQPLMANTPIDPSSRLENDSGIWWYVSSDVASGWVLESDVTLR